MKINNQAVIAQMYQFVGSPIFKTLLKTNKKMLPINRNTK